jgi:hypothetical protein
METVRHNRTAVKTDGQPLLNTDWVFCSGFLFAKLYRVEENGRIRKNIV